MKCVVSPLPLALFATLVAAAVPTLARAGEFDDGGIFLSTGLNLGTSIHDEAFGLIVGGEVSAGIGWVREKEDDTPNAGSESWNLGEPRWLGVYFDAMRDFKTDTTRLSFGPEGGAMILGLDGGPMVELGEGESRWGFTVRPVITVSWVAVYGRWNHFFDGMEENSVEFGILAKYPFMLHDF
jgi:hypothetical protein